jgi:IS30 family transposase
MPHQQYTHISNEERIIIENRLENGESLRKIASAIGRSPSTLSREIGRNCTPNQNITTRVNHSPLQNIGSRHFRDQAFIVTIRDSKTLYYEQLKLDKFATVPNRLRIRLAVNRQKLNVLPWH